MFLQRLKDLREDKDKTQKEIAEEVLHCQRTVYRRYERAEHAIPAWVVATLADYYGVSADYILELTDDPKPYKRIQRKK